MSEWHKIECVKRTRQFLHETGFGQMPENNNPWPTNVPAPPQPPKMECQAQQQQHSDSFQFCSPSDQANSSSMANSEPNPRKSSLDSLMPRQQQLAHPQGQSAEQNRPLSTGMQPNSSDTIRYLAEGEELEEEEEEGQQMMGIGQSENVAQPMANPPFNAAPADFVDYGQVVAPANGQWAISWEQQCQAAHWMSIVDWQAFQQQMPFHCQLALDSFQPSPVGEQLAKVPLAATENVPSQPIAQPRDGKKRQHQKQTEMGKNVQAQPLLQPASSSTSQPQNPVGIGHPGIGGMALAGQQMAEYHGTMLAQVKDFAKSPIIDFLCQVLSNTQQFGSICSFIAKREFKIHHPRTFMDLLNVIKGSPQHKDKSYLQISRALKTYEDRRIEGQVMMRKVAAKRNQYKFFPDMP